MPDLTPHKYSENPTTGVVSLVEVKEYRLYRGRNLPDVYLQAGRFVDASDREFERSELIELFGAEAIERFESDGVPPETMLLSEETQEQLQSAAKKANELWAMSAMLKR